MLGSWNRSTASARSAVTESGNLFNGGTLLGSEFTGELVRHFEAAQAGGRELAGADFRARPLALKLRDHAAWLMSPYL